MQLKNNPCKGCVQDRHPGCHAECEKYKAAKKEHAEMMMEIIKDRHVSEYIADQAAKRAKRYKKR